MAGLYVDTSALGRVLLAEPDALVIIEAIDRYAESWSSELLGLELRRLAARTGLVGAAATMLAAVRTVPLDSASLDRAALIEPQTVRALDAIHLDAAVHLRARGEIAAMLTFDGQLQVGCAHHGIPVVAPTA